MHRVVLNIRNTLPYNPGQEQDELPFKNHVFLTTDFLYVNMSYKLFLLNILSRISTMVLIDEWEIGTSYVKYLRHIFNF